MHPFRTSLLIILGINVLAILFMAFTVESVKRNTSEEPELFDLEMEDIKYRFENPVKASQILEQLDVFSTMPRNFVRGTNFTAFSSGLKINNNYCSEHRTLFVNHPELVFEEMNIFTNFYKSHKLRSEVIPAIQAVDMHPEISLTRKWIGDEYTHDLKRNINIFYSTNLFFYRRQVGKQFSCLSQASNHIPGHDNMYRKDRVGQIIS
jgi:cytochrome c biogenesis protein ResB